MADQENSAIPVKIPIKVLHFSDGDLEIFEDDDKPEETKEKEPEVNEKELAWTPWFFHKAKRIGNNVINGIDYTGEKLADFLNITTPKYAYEIEQFKKDEAKRLEEEKELKENTWTDLKESPMSEPIVTAPPRVSSDLQV